MSLIATTTKKDFSFMGKFLFVGMIALLIAMIANMFLQIPALALTMVPTVAGAFVGLSTSGIIMQHPIMASLLMIGAIIGLQFAIAANRNSGLGVMLLLGMTFILGWWLGPLLNFALRSQNGPQLIGIAAIGTGASWSQ